MKKIIFIMLLSVTFLSCKKEDSHNEEDEGQTYFIRVVSESVDGTLDYSPVIKYVHR